MTQFVISTLAPFGAKSVTEIACLYIVDCAIISLFLKIRRTEQ